MNDDSRAPLVTYTGMARAGRAMATVWENGRARPEFGRFASFVEFFDEWSSPRDGSEFPTVLDESVDDQARDAAAREVSEESREGPAAFGYALLGLIGLLCLCAVYPFAVWWFLVLVGAENSPALWGETIVVAATVSLALAFLADRLIPQRIALLLIALAPFAVILALPAILTGKS